MDGAVRSDLCGDIQKVEEGCQAEVFDFEGSKLIEEEIDPVEDYDYREKIDYDD